MKRSINPFLIAPLFCAAINCSAAPPEEESSETATVGATAVIDGHWSTVGTSNLDPLSLRMNLEVNAFVEDQDFAAALEVMFEEDLPCCEEVTLESWKQRRWWHRFVSRLAYILRNWL